ncbi:hypothetical protein CEXT_646971 [Caerostris extrusa]|uniref:Uncharacterized protein n=1 Tax=Caerostris extrusa TaxID=172846 RepID=A0AAV4U699_CAEEX|nr:hypothetical protein CEXT_646971 [Caerostris extrusa]
MENSALERSLIFQQGFQPKSQLLRFHFFSLSLSLSLSFCLSRMTPPGGRTESNDNDSPSNYRVTSKKKIVFVDCQRELSDDYLVLLLFEM